MSTKLSDEEKAIGHRNFNQARADLGAAQKDPDRRTFLKAAAAGAAVIPVSAAVYFGYEQWKGNKAVRTAIIGTGDEGGVLIGEHNPEYNQIVAVCDVRAVQPAADFRGRGERPAEGAEQDLRQGGGAQDREVRQRGRAARREDPPRPGNGHHRHPAVHAQRDRRQVHGGRAACAVREADGPHHRPVQGDDRGGRRRTACC